MVKGFKIWNIGPENHNTLFIMCRSIFVRPHITFGKRRYNFLGPKKGSILGFFPIPLALGVFWGVLSDTFLLTTSPLPEHRGGQFWCGTFLLHPLAPPSSSLLPCVVYCLRAFYFHPKITLPSFLYLVFWSNLANKNLFWLIFVVLILQAAKLLH